MVGKHSKKYILPRQPSAYWTFAVAKVLMLLVLLTYVAFICTWSFYTMQYFKDQIIRLNEANPHGGVKSTSETLQYMLSARETQRLQTHRHFFLFTGLFLFGSSLIALYGVAKELTSLLLGFIVMQTLSLGFEYIGALKSNDPQVMHLKTISIALSPIMILLGAMFTLMIRRMEQKASAQPTYRQTIIGGLPKFSNRPAPIAHVTSAQSPVTVTVPNNQFPRMQSSQLMPKDLSGGFGGQVNLALNLDDERTAHESA